MAQKDIAALRSQAQEIRDETTTNANTATRVGTMNEDQNDSAINAIETSNQSIVSNVEFKSQATVEGSEATESTTIAINFTTGTNSQEINITGNISSFTTTEEKSPGNYDVWLVNDGSVRTVVAPTGWLLIPGGDTHDTAANAINLYQFKVSPSGIKKYIIKNM